MLTRFISDKSYDTMNVEYPFDDNMDIKNIQLNVDGNLVPLLMQDIFFRFVKENQNMLRDISNI
jgi:hypothetical protein